MCLLAAGLVVLLSSTNSSSQDQKSPTQTCQRDTFKIALDVGHDLIHSGATSARGKTEFSYNLLLARLVLHGLKEAGFDQAFIISESGAPMPLGDRPKIAQIKGAALFISLHHDSAQKQYFSEWVFERKLHLYSDLFHGYSIFVSSNSSHAKESLKLATALGQALVARGLTPSLHHAEDIAGERRKLLNSALGIYQFDELAVLRGATMPALLLESAVIVNRDEELAIQSGLYHPKIVAALISAIFQYCSSPTSDSRKD